MVRDDAVITREAESILRAFKFLGMNQFVTFPSGEALPSRKQASPAFALLIKAL
jgi:hypothetical protein